MKKIVLVLLCTSVVVFGSLQVSRADLFNGGFETGDFSGWTLSMPSLSLVADSATLLDPAAGGGYVPMEGDFLARIFMGEAGATASQQVALIAGTTLSGFAAFQSLDVGPDLGDDNAFVNILNANGVLIATPWSAHASSLTANGNDFGFTPFELWSWVVPTDGLYILQLGIANPDGNGSFNGQALFDGNLVSNPVPEPSTILLVLGGSGFFGLAALRRKLR